jgi:hypothetical protein
MADDAAPRSPTYGFKAPEFHRVNAERPAAPEPVRPEDLPLPPLDRRAFEVKELAQLAHAGRDPLGRNTPTATRNDVHTTLDLNHQRAAAAGLFYVAPTPDLKRRRRWRNYLLAMLVTNGIFVPLAVMSGPRNRFLFVYAIAGSAICSSVITWQVWGLRTE